MVDIILKELRDYPTHAPVTRSLLSKHCGYTIRVMQDMLRNVGEITPVRQVWAARIKALGTEDPTVVRAAIRDNNWNTAAHTGFKDAYGYPLPKLRWSASQEQLATLETVAKTTKTISGQARELKLKAYQIRLLWKLKSRTTQTQKPSENLQT